MLLILMQTGNNPFQRNRSCGGMQRVGQSVGLAVPEAQESDTPPYESGGQATDIASHKQEQFRGIDTVEGIQNKMRKLNTRSMLPKSDASNNNGGSVGINTSSWHNPSGVRRGAFGKGESVCWSDSDLRFRE